MILLISNVFTAPLDYYCDQPVDVALLLDSSSYFNQINFQEQKKFAQSFITYFKLRSHLIGPAIAVVPYSDKEITRSSMVNFIYSTSISRLNNKIKKLKYQGGRSNLDYALRFTKDQLFTPGSVRPTGARSWVPRVVVVITGSWRTWSSSETREVLNHCDESPTSSRY